MMSDTILEEKVLEELWVGNIIASEKIDYLRLGDFDLIVDSNKGKPFYLLYNEDEIEAELKLLESGNYEVTYVK